MIYGSALTLLGEYELLLLLITKFSKSLVYNKSKLYGDIMP